MPVHIYLRCEFELANFILSLNIIEVDISETRR